MKTSEMRDLSLAEAQRNLGDLQEELFNLRFQHKIGQIENPQKLKQTKRDIARLKTVINETFLKRQIKNS